MTPSVDDRVITKTSPRSVTDTVTRLSDLVLDKGLQVFAVFDHSGEAHRHGLVLRDTTVVVFGSPIAGTPAMEYEPLSALDLPLKVLIWDDNGTTRVSYTAPDVLSTRYGLPPDVARGLAGIDTITDALVET